MKLLLFSDLHCDRAAAQRIVDLSAQVDVVCGAGDFASVRRGLEQIIAVLQVIQRPAVLVPGNAETAAELQATCRDWPTAQVLHGAGTVIDGVSFYGLGGAVPVTPFGSWSFDLTESEASQLLADCPAECVLVSHSPPHGLLDVSSAGQHLGSTAVRDTILGRHPRLVVCGHVHDSCHQTAMLGPTAVVNAGPQGMPWDL